MESKPILSWFGILPLAPRDPTEPHRRATPLELLFDLVSVIAVASAAASLHHAILAFHITEGAEVLSLFLCHLVGVDELHLVRLCLRQQ